MKKTIQCKPVDELELVFNDGEALHLRFDVQSLTYLQGIEGNMKALKNKSLPELCALLVYAGGVNHNEGLTQEKARAIVSDLSLETITAIVSEFSDSLGGDFTDEMTKKMMAQFLKKLK